MSHDAITRSAPAVLCTRPNTVAAQGQTGKCTSLVSEMTLYCGRLCGFPVRRWVASEAGDVEGVFVDVRGQDLGIKEHGMNTEKT